MCMCIVCVGYYALAGLPAFHMDGKLPFSYPEAFATLVINISNCWVLVWEKIWPKELQAEAAEGQEDPQTNGPVH